LAKKTPTSNEKPPSISKKKPPIKFENIKKKPIRPSLKRRTIRRGAHFRFVCDGCEEEFSTSDSLDSHQDSDCPKKDTQYGSQDLLSDTEGLEDTNKAEKGVPEDQEIVELAPSLRPEKTAFSFVCKVSGCSYWTNKKKLFDLHSYGFKHVKYGGCKFCPFISPRRNLSVLLDHLARHSFQKIYACSFCYYISNDERFLKIHLSKEHQDVKLDESEEVEEEEKEEIIEEKRKEGEESDEKKKLLAALFEDNYDDKMELEDGDAISKRKEKGKEEREEKESGSD